MIISSQKRIYRYLRSIGIGCLALFAIWGCARKELVVDPEEAISEQREFRAVWVSLLGEGLRSPEEIRQLCQAARRANLNTIVAQVHREGAVMFRSRLAPPHASIANSPGFDPLATLLKEARDTSDGKSHLDVHAWFNVFRIGPQTNYLDSMPPPIAVAHPDWYTRNREGKLQWELDPGVPAVQDHLLAVVEECLKNYDVDGINLDYIRYFGPDRGYNLLALERFLRETGREEIPGPEDEAWKAFRRDQVTDFVKRCAISVWTHRPGAIFSVNVVGWSSAPIIDFSETRPYAEVMQDWRGWWEEGLVDAALLMNYKREWDETQALDFRNWADYTLSLAEKRSGGGMIAGIGGYFNPHDDVLVQYREVMERGLGASLFSYDRPTEESAKSPEQLGGHRSPIWDILGKDIYPKTASPSPPDWRGQRSFIAGYLKDASGEPLAGRTVALRRTAHRATSDGSGFFAFFDLPPRNYRLGIPEHPLDGQTIEALPGTVTWLEPNPSLLGITQ